MNLAAFKNRTLFVVSMIIMGSMAGVIVWFFVSIMDLCLRLIWTELPSLVALPGLPILVCLVGGLLIGLHHRLFGDYPESLDTVLKKVKQTNRYEYKNIAVYSSAALLPLIFGASVGPEAGLTGMIAGLCTWIGDRMKRFGSDFNHMTQIGISATLSAIFTAPLFGFAAPILGSTSGDPSTGEEETFTLPKSWKIVVYLCSIAGALGAFILLNTVFGREGGLPHFSTITYGLTEIVWAIPLIAAGAAAGWLYHIFDGISLYFNSKLGKRPVLKALLGGLLLSLLGIVLPFTMFSGESQALVIADVWHDIAVPMLFATGIVKLFVTSYCIRSGWRGGHFFPAIFSGISIGLGFASISGADPVFCMCACASALVGALTKQPVLTVLLLFLCFPVKGIVIMIAAAAVGSIVPLPKRFRQQLD